MSDIEIDTVKFEDNKPQETLKWAIERFPKIRLASSFGPEDIVLMHMAKEIKPDIEIFFLETGYHFKETENLKERLKNEWNLNLLELYPEITIEAQNEKYGDKLYQTNPDLCCKIRKVEPLERALSCIDAWITGLRRDQAPTRKDTPVVGKDNRGLYKISPLV